MAEPVDLSALSRDVARVHERIAKGFEDPFMEQRHVATQSTYRALVESEPPAHEALVRDALLRWVHELLQRRVGADLASDERVALDHVDDRFIADPPGTFAEARRTLLLAPNAAVASSTLERLALLAPRVAAVRKERRSHRFEAAKRLGVAHPLALALDVPKLLDAARGVLDATEDIAEDRRRRARLLTTSAAHSMQHALARDANDGWPACLGARWLEEAFAALVTRPFAAPPLPTAIGGASFLLAAFAWGQALRLAGTAKSLPFVLARDPYPRDAFRFGATLATAVADPLFQKKRLGLANRGASAQSRILRGTLLSEMRVEAVRALLVAQEHVDPGTFEELTTRAFGAPLPTELRDAWPEPRVDELARLAGLLEAHAFTRDLVERFDEDWFVNPRAGAHFAAIASGPIFADHPIDVKAPEAIGRAFERWLG